METDTENGMTHTEGAESRQRHPGREPGRHFGFCSIAGSHPSLRVMTQRLSETALKHQLLPQLCVEP